MSGGLINMLANLFGYVVIIIVQQIASHHPDKDYLHISMYALAIVLTICLGMFICIKN
jgi:hypothetical protein